MREKPPYFPKGFKPDHLRDGIMAIKTLLKNNQIIGEAAIRCGVRYYFGYPITPQNELVEHMANRLPQLGGVFIQSDSELAASNMLAGCAGAGKLPMASTSGPGISLMSEALSFLACAELPCLIVNVMRVGPGDGDIRGSQGDYLQAVKGGGHGDYHVIVIAPSSGQEIVHEISRSIRLAKRYRSPVLVLVDGLLGQMSEPVTFPRPMDRTQYKKKWALTGAKGRERNLVRTYFNDLEESRAYNLRLQRKYRQIQSKEQRWEELEVENAEVILVSFGIVGRIASTAIREARSKGLKLGLIRPITLWPFPEKAFRHLPGSLHSFLVIEQNAGQMLEDVKLAVNGRAPVEFLGKLGGDLPTVKEILRISKKLVSKSPQ